MSAKDITEKARKALKENVELAKELGFEVIYCDSDSNEILKEKKQNG